MGTRGRTVWIVLVACWFALVVGIPRTAFAAAPICDERAASAIAPSPALMAADISWELGTKAPCSDLALPIVASTRIGSDPSERTPKDSDTSLDVLGPPTDAVRVWSSQSTSTVLAPVPLALLPGHYPPVFRPPRRSIGS